MGKLKSEGCLRRQSRCIYIYCCTLLDSARGCFAVPLAALRSLTVPDLISLSLFFVVWGRSLFRNMRVCYLIYCEALVRYGSIKSACCLVTEPVWPRFSSVGAVRLIPETFLVAACCLKLLSRTRRASSEFELFLCCCTCMMACSRGKYCVCCCSSKGGFSSCVELLSTDLISWLPSSLLAAAYGRLELK